MSDLEIPVDDDGCVANMEGLGSTVEYNQYRQFSLLMGVLTIIIGSLGLVGNVIRYQSLDSTYLSAFLSLNPQYLHCKLYVLRESY